jgi:hypothetical protein
MGFCLRNTEQTRANNFRIIIFLDSPIVKAIKQQVHFSSGHTASVGCVINSNPPSTILWYKNENLIIPSQQDTKYEIIMFHQINQTVTYLKINV